MLIFLVCANLLALGIFLFYYGENNNSENLIFGGGTLLTVAGLTIIIAIMILLVQGNANLEKANQLKIDYANLNYYVHHLEDYKERTLVEAINRYNVELKDLHAKQSSPWLNWFYPGDISECEYIIWVDKNGK